MLNVMIAHANSAGARWASWIVVASLDSALLLALIGLAWLAIRDRVTPQAGYCLFLLIPLKLLTPVVVTVPTAVAQWTPSALVSSWFKATHPTEKFEGRPAVDIQEAGRTAPSEQGPGPISQAQAVAVAAHRPTSPAEPRSGRRIAATASPSAHPVVEAQRLSASSTVMIAWLVGVLLLLGRFAGAQLRLRRHLQDLTPLDESSLAVDLRELRRRAGAPPTVRIVESDGVASPSVWGIARPTIILPTGIAASLTAQQLRWVLLHELAHVRRHDLIVVTLQRFAAILYFFNPAIWIANRIIHQLREYSCDDFALSQGDSSSAVESGEAFVRILRHADRSRSGLEGTLGIFGLDSRACCVRRVHRLLDTERTIRAAPDARSIWALILLAVVSAPHLRASSSARPADPQEAAKESAAKNQADSKAADELPAKVVKGFELRVVGPDGRPVPKANVSLRTSPHPTAKQIRLGQFVRDHSYGAIVATDAEGRLVVELPPAPERFNVDVTIPGYGPYWAGWSSESHAEPIPLHFTAELEAAWSGGGIIVDAEGKAAEGVNVRPSIEYKKRPGDTHQFGVGARVKTDAAGKWRFDSVPTSMSEVHVEIDHPSFKGVRRPLTRAAFGIERGQEPTAKIALERGLTVTGKITDEAGKPIAGALVHTKFLNDIREATTGPDGVYKLVGCEPLATRIVASAKGRATDMKELNVEADMGPVDFQMKPGGTVRVRVLDAQGRPAAKARIFFQDWRGRFNYFEFDHVNQYADANGVWVWHEAPLDEFKADICPPDGMELLEQPLIAREEEYVFRTPAPLVVSGKVVDAATKQPIKKFRVVPGFRSSPTYMNWARRDSFPATNGRFEFRPNRGYLAHLIRIEADGYRAGVSREIKSTEGNVSIDLELKKGTNIAAKVEAPAGTPAAGARIALGTAGSEISIKNGDVDDGSTYNSPRATTDDSGRFLFPAQDADFQLMITHSEGFAHIKSTPEWDPTKVIQLEPWARVEGIFRVGRTPVANAQLTINVSSPHSYGPDVPSIFTTYYATTGPDGRFVFERVFPGAARIGRNISLMLDAGAVKVTSSCMIAADFPAGKTTRIDLGGTGRTVVGTLRPPAGFDQKVRWNFALVSAEFEKSATSGPYLTATVDRDGKFRIDDVPDGEYELGVQFRREDAGHLFNHRFKVPPPDGDLAAQPVDLGVLRLEKR